MLNKVIKDILQYQNKAYDIPHLKQIYNLNVRSNQILILLLSLNHKNCIIYKENRQGTIKHNLMSQEELFLNIRQTQVHNIHSNNHNYKLWTICFDLSMKDK